MDAKTKSFFLKTSYYRSYWYILAGIIGFIICLKNITKEVEDYPKVSGRIIHSQIRWHNTPFDLELEGKRWYFIYYKKLFPVLKEKAVKGKQATIWYDKKNKIQQLIIENEMVYEYDNATWFWIFFMAFCIFLSVGNVVYIIKHPAHARGKAL